MFTPRLRAVQAVAFCCLLLSPAPLGADELGRVVRLDKERLQTRKPIRTIAFSADGRMCVLGSECGKAILATLDGRVLSWIEVDHRPVTALALSPDGKTLLAGGIHGEIYVCDVSQSRCVHTWRARKLEDIALVGFCRGGTTRIAASTEGSVWLYDETGKEVRSWPARDGGAPLALCDGCLLARSTPRQIDLLDLDSGLQRPFAELKGGKIECISADRRVVLSATESGRAVRFELTEVAGGTTIASWNEHGANVTTAALSPDGRFAVSALGGGPLHFRELVSQLETPLRDDGRMNRVAFAPSGRKLVLADAEGGVTIQDLRGPAVRGSSGQSLDALWRGLGGLDARLALEAALELAERAEESVPFLLDRLTNEAPPAESRTVQQLIAALNDDAFRVRSEAYELLKLRGLEAAPALKVAANGAKSAEVRRRAGEILEQIRVSGCPPERLRPVRAVMALEHAATPAALETLTTLSRTAPGAWLREEARVASERLGVRLKPERK